MPSSVSAASARAGLSLSEILRCNPTFNKALAYFMPLSPYILLVWCEGAMAPRVDETLYGNHRAYQPVAQNIELGEAVNGCQYDG